MIRNKLILAYLLPTVCLLVAAGVLIYAQARASLEEELGRRLIAVAEATVGSMPSGEPRRLAKLTAEDASTLKRLREKLEAIRATTGVRRIFVADTQLRSLVDTRPEVAFGDPLFDLQADQVEMARVFAAPTGASASSVLFTGRDGTRYKNGYAPVAFDGQVVATIGVEGSAEFFTVIGDFRLLMILVGVLSLLAIVLVSALVARSINQPISALEEASRRLGRGDLGTEIALERDDEFRTLANAFNEMRQDLLDRDRQLQMMLSGIAHEVRNPLGGMELFCGLMAEEVEELDGEHPQLTEYVSRITRELHYLKRVVNDFLDYARRKPLEWARFPVGEFFGEVVQLMTWELESVGVALSVAPGAEALELTADRDALHRVLLNLVRNAGQASPSDTRIELSCRAVDAPEAGALPELTAFAAHVFFDVPATRAHSGPWRAIFIRDQGHGIPPEKLETIFEAFFTTREKGSGLGLALTTKVVEEHGGALAVASTSAVGEISSDDRTGTLMVVILPFKEEIEPAVMEIPDGWLG